ncbi:hypothetical protein LK994_13770 [Ferruginibacter lapsinanis]|uniref:hypothetical protein n=1 Tax=Ferruginibacter lapsinanis TaxID=563172 RepID=UPI001E4D11E7|nr:hypothetical protein [Ferruginibacter lapsinanis]UEG49705.1 hypothetical protein LK994_13770 [Ferruginibacter lapsinanis]
MFTYFLCWFPMLLIAILNGTARDLWYKKYLGELTAHQVSTISLIIMFGVYINCIVKMIPPRSGEQAVYIGLLWLALTLLFEFGFGLARGNALSNLLAEYNILKGRVWIFIPIWVAIAPYLFYKINS